MSNRFIVGCDGSPASERAAAFAVAQAKASGASITVVHVVEWSPYAFLTPEELAERHKQRTEELERAREHIVDPLLKAIADDDVEIDSELRHGHVSEILAQVATETGAEQIFIGRTGHSEITARIFGSVASTMAQMAPVPCTIVP